MADAELSRNCPHGHDVDLSGVTPGLNGECRVCKVPGACPQCPPGGKRVAVRRRVGSAAASAAADRADPWGRPPLPSWDGQHHAGPPVGDCPACDNDDARPTPRGTLLWCASARRFVLPPAVAAKMAAAADRAAAVRRPRAEVADPAAELRAALVLEAERAKSAAVYREWAEVLDPDGLPPAVAQACRTLCAAFIGADGRGGLARAAERAETAAALETVRQVAAEVITQARALEDEVNDERERAERLADDDGAELDDDGPGPGDSPGDGQAERARLAVSLGVPVIPGRIVQDGAARAIGQAIEARGQWAGDTRGGTAAPPLSARDMLAAKMARDRARIKQYGHCARGRHGLFGTTPAPKRRVVGNNTGVSGYESYGAPVIYICGSVGCLDWADAEFRRAGYQDCTYSELP